MTGISEDGCCRNAEQPFSDSERIKIMDILKDGTYQLNCRNLCDGMDLMKKINDSVIAAAFFDPQYRGVLDKLKYGNEGKGRCKARSELPQMDDETIIRFIREIGRVLKDSGHLMLWTDKFHLCGGIQKWTENTGLNLVDMVVWDKGKMGMGYRTRRKSEYLIILQKTPVRAKVCWNDHAIPDVWQELKPTTHPHSKPIELQRRIISAVTNEGDTVLDPASGGYSVLKACQMAGRDFIGGDIFCS